MILPLVGTRSQRSRSVGCPASQQPSVLSTNQQSMHNGSVHSNDTYLPLGGAGGGGGCATRVLDRCRSISTKQDRYDAVSLSRICRVAINQNSRHSFAASKPHSLHGSDHGGAPVGKVVLAPLAKTSCTPLPLARMDNPLLTPSPSKGNPSTAISSTATLQAGLAAMTLSPCSTRSTTPLRSHDCDPASTNVSSCLRGSPASHLLRRRTQEEGSPTLCVRVPQLQRRYSGGVDASSADPSPRLQLSMERDAQLHKRDAEERLESFCSLPLPEELLPMEDAPVDVYRCVVLIQEHRSAQLALRHKE